jgi:hypothetical protein
MSLALDQAAQQAQRYLNELRRKQMEIMLDELCQFGAAKALIKEVCEQDEIEEG